MTIIIKALFDGKGPVANAYDDLISSGIPQEKIRRMNDKFVLSVMVPDATQAEIVEILKRHEPLDLVTREEATA